MKNRIMKVLCILLSASMCFSLVGCGTVKSADVNTETEVASAQEIYEQTNAYLGSTKEGSLLTGETVYILSDVEGKVDKVIESKKDSVNGEYIKTEVKTAPPVEVTVEYYFNGNRVKPESIVGKDGELTIRYNYKNNTKVKVTKDGKDEEVLVPFTMMTGVILDNEIFHNVEAVNAKVVDDGSRCIVVGYAFPGLQESLELSEDVFEIPEYVEIKADVKGFAMAPGITLATNELFNKEDVEGKERIDNLEKDLDEDLNKLTDAVGQLKDGAEKLSNGMNTLQGKSGELKDGVSKLADGAGTLQKGANDLDNGVAGLKKGAGDLQNGLDTLKGNNEALVGGAKQVFEALLATADTSLTGAGVEHPALTIENYDAVLEAILEGLDSGKVMQAARAKVEAQIDAMGDALYIQALGGDEQAQAMAALLPEEKKAAIREAAIRKTLNENPEVQAALAKASAGETQIMNLKAQLDQYNAFYQGLVAYTNGVAQAADGAGKLKAGAEQLKDGSAKLASGAGELANGTYKLKDAMPALEEGVNALADGSSQLKNGMQRLDEEGIQKILDAKEDKLDHVSERIEILRDASAIYTKSQNLKEGEGLKYLYRMDGME